MHPCPHCGVHVRDPDPSCFACGHPARPARGPGVALLLGLAVACAPIGTTKEDSGTPEHSATLSQPTYGTTPIHTGVEADTDTDADTDADTDPDTGSTSTSCALHTGHTGHSGAH